MRGRSASPTYTGLKFSTGRHTPYKPRILRGFFISRTSRMSPYKSNFVIKRENLPKGFHLGALVAFWLLLSHFAAPSWAFYVFYAFAALVVIAGWIGVYNDDHVDIFAAVDVVQTPVPCDCEQPKRPPGYTIKAGQIVLERTHANCWRVTLCDENGKEVYRFRDYEIAPGMALTLRGMRIEADMIFQ
jgi:hypothetical protein